MPAKSSQLINTLRDLLATQAVGTQEEIKLALTQLGFSVNQTKISRMLHKLGAIKTKNETGQIVYQLPKEPLPAASSAVLADLITDIIFNEIVIIIRTSPGSASLIARLLDHHQQKLHIIGTVAGDDTIIVIPKSVKQINATVSSIKSLLLNL